MDGSTPGTSPPFDARRWRRQFAVAHLQDLVRDWQNPQPGPDEVLAAMRGPHGSRTEMVGGYRHAVFQATDLEHVAVTRVGHGGEHPTHPNGTIGAKVASKHEAGHAKDDMAADKANAYADAVRDDPASAKADWAWYLAEREKALANRVSSTAGSPCVWVDQSGCGGSIDTGAAFQIPDEANWGSHVIGADCGLKGTEGDCPAPQVHATQSCEVCADCSNAYIPYINADGCPAGFNIALRLAWCFLVENIDIVKWVICRVWGVSPDCVVNLLTTGDDAWGANVDITCADLSDVVAITWAWPWPLGPTITWASGGRHVKRYAGIVSCSTSAAERLCAIIDLASVLLHELCHACLAGADIASTSSNCTDALLVEHSARWAFLQRFPTALTASCCRGPWDTNSDGVVNEAEFMDTSGTLVGSTCDSTC